MKRETGVWAGVARQRVKEEREEGYILNRTEWATQQMTSKCSWVGHQEALATYTVVPHVA